MASTQQLETWLKRTASGDRKAFALLYAATSGRLFAVLVRVLQRRDWAEEALQDCFVKIWLKAHTYEPDKSAPLTWMVSVARNRALDLLRATRHEIELPLSEVEEGRLPPMILADEREDPGARAEEQQELQCLRDCLRGMDPAQRKVLELAYFDGYTQEELAVILNVPLGTVKSRIRRGLARLRALVSR